MADMSKADNVIARLLTRQRRGVRLQIDQGRCIAFHTAADTVRLRHRPDDFEAVVGRSGGEQTGDKLSASAADDYVGSIAVDMAALSPEEMLWAHRIDQIIIRDCAGDEDGRRSHESHGNASGMLISKRRVTSP